MWIVFGTGEKTTRVPGGAKVERHCEQCGELASFYEKEIIATFRLYFIDVFDYGRHRVMACGCCGACYATDELGVPATRTHEADTRGTLGESAARVAHGVGGYIDRAADAFEAGISSLLSDERPKVRVSDPATTGARAGLAQRGSVEKAPGGGDARRDDLDDDDPLADPLEKRFRVLESKAGARIKID
jgi:hypothetical protein